MTKTTSAGTVVFSKAQTVKWCMEADDKAVAVIQGYSSALIRLEAQFKTTCSAEVTYGAMPAPNGKASVVISGYQGTGGVTMQFWYQDQSDPEKRVYPGALQLS